MMKPTTPSSTWFQNGEPDPHAGRYDCERHELDMGDLTDDQLANGVFMHGNETPPIEHVIAGVAKMPIVWLTAAKSRIRWLSRRLQKRETQVEDMAPLIRQLARKLDKANPGNDLSRRAMAYLSNNGFKADHLRKRPGQSTGFQNNLCCEVSMHPIDPRIEVRAKEIYANWSDQTGFVPWVENGNSLKQEEARYQARKDLELGV